MGSKLRIGIFTFFLALGFIVPAMPGGADAEIKFFGDLRLRTEYEDNKSFNNERYRWRQRYRLRFGAKADITESVQVGFRFASGEKTYQTTGNQTFDSPNFADFDFPLDRVYARYRTDVGGAKFTFHAGKFGHQFWYPTEILWDQDLQPSGIAETIVLPGAGLTINAAQYVIRQADRNDLPGGGQKGNEVYAVQAVHDRDWGAFGTKVGVAYYNVADAGQICLDAVASDWDFRTNKNFGNAACSGTISDFQLLNINVQVSLLRDSVWPVKFIGEYVNNLGAEKAVVNGNNYDEEDTAWLVGVHVGTKKPGTWRFWLAYSQIEADAVVANFNSDDLQQTNVNTIYPQISYQITKNMSIDYDGYYQTRNNYQLARDNGNAIDDTTQYRHRINWRFKF